MARLYFVPGILGSELRRNSGVDLLVWVSKLSLFNGMGVIALAPDGVSPRVPDGDMCFAGQPLGYQPTGLLSRKPMYGQFLAKMRAMPQLYNYVVTPFGYDWRLQMLHTGNELATKIVAQVSPSDDPCVIVAHSQGGLVARVAWSILNESGRAQLVRRIVTIATPHRGSYSPAMVWSGDDEVLSQLMDGYRKNPFSTVTLLELQNVAATWPSMYELMPLLDQAAGISDPYRAALFVKSNWPDDVQLSERWLHHALFEWQPFLRAPASLPPYSVLTTGEHLQGVAVVFPLRRRPSRPFKRHPLPCGFGYSNRAAGIWLLWQIPAVHNHVRHDATIGGLSVGRAGSAEVKLLALDSDMFVAAAGVPARGKLRNAWHFRRPPCRRIGDSFPRDTATVSRSRHRGRARIQRAAMKLRQLVSILSRKPQALLRRDWNLHRVQPDGRTSLCGKG